MMKKFSFKKSQTLSDFQNFISNIYSLPDDRLFSIFDLLANQERFTMRALKGIRKGDQKKLKLNLLIAFSWLMSVANRLHIPIEDEIWRRFPYLCSYCGRLPCVCKKIKLKNRIKISRKSSLRPKTLYEMQEMFKKIYPPSSRSLADAGVHLAEEMGEVSEAIHNFLGEHKNKQFIDVQNEIADYISCFFGVSNSAKIPVAKELEKMFYNNCHICHCAPCICKFSFIAKFES